MSRRGLFGLRDLFGLRRRDRELDEEIRAHLEMAVRDRVERGEDPRDAERAVRREFGNLGLVRETTRQMWGWRLLEETWQDIRYALRRMRGSPGVTAVIVISLALGIGANTAIFSLVYSVMLRPLPVERPGELVELLQKYPGEPRGNGYWTQRSYQYYRENTQTFADLTAFAIDNIADVEVKRSPAGTAVAEYVAGNYFPMLGLEPTLGRLVGPDDPATTPQGSVTVLSWSAWNRWYGRNPDVLGKRIVVNDVPAVIIGVAPREYTGLRSNAQAELWLPLRSDQQVGLLARLKPGATVQQARAEMTGLYRFTIAERMENSSDPQVANLRVEVESARSGMATARDMVGQPLTVLMGVVSVLLLLACVNVAGLLVARGAARSREMALRLGLGAGRGRLVRQILTESLLLSAAGTLAGVLIAYLGTTFLLQMLDSGRPHERIRLLVYPDANMLLFTAGVALIAGLGFGLAPALGAIGRAPSEALRQSGRTSETRLQRLFARSLVVAQVALSMLLVSAGGVFGFQLAGLERADLGFRRDRTLLVSLDSSRDGYDRAQRAAVYRELMDRLQALPGVRSVSLGGPTPLQGPGAAGWAAAEGFEERPEDRRRVSIGYAAPGYFETLETPVIAGRGFRYDDRAAAVINQATADHYFSGRDPIGEHVTLSQVTGKEGSSTYEIVGVVGNTHYYEIREDELRIVYLAAFRDGGVSGGSFVIRTDVDPTSIGETVRQTIADTAPPVGITKITTLADQIDSSIVPERLMAALTEFFALLGALLAGIGLYGLLAYTVTRRTHEIGIRVALGASPGEVLRMVWRDALVVVAVGLFIGAPAVYWGKALAEALAGDSSGNLTALFVIPAAALVAVAAVAAFGPARRAAQVDPAECLRQE